MGGWPLGSRARLLQPLYRAASTDSSRRHRDSPGDPTKRPQGSQLLSAKRQAPPGNQLGETS
jgi:hypothetical protein